MLGPVRERKVARLEPSEMIADAAETLPDFDDPAFGAMFDRFADRRVVLLGEASLSEFYRARAAITRCLVEEHHFNIVAVEWDSCVRN
jgi:erythromycin esterase-like protein